MIVFFIIIFSILFSLQLLVFITFKRFLDRKEVSPRIRFLLTAVPFIWFNAPLIVMLFDTSFVRELTGVFQILIAYPFYIFQASIIFIGLFLLIGKILKLPFSFTAWILTNFRMTRLWFERFKKRKEVMKFDQSRRKFVTGTAAVVSGYAFIGAGVGAVSKNSYKIEYVDIPLKNLPDELKKTTFTLISDVHSGPYMNESLMNKYVEVVNNLNSDYVFIPGDLVNSNLSEATTFSNAFKRLHAKKGIYATLGNHDFFTDADEVVKIITNETPLKILRNDAELLDINGHKLCLLGTDDTRDSGGRYNEIILEYLNEAVKKAKEKSELISVNYEELPKILLYHKPYLFKDISDKKIDLTLSGHTHGGQVVLAKFGNLNLSLASTVSEYVSGLYREGDSSMYVSRGLGSVGLPIRLNCPPEVTVIRLM